MVRTFNYQRSRKDPEATLLDFLTAKFTYHTRDQWRDVIEHKGWCQVDGATTRDPHLPLPRTCTIGFDVPAEAEPDVDATLTLMHLDEAICVVSKSGNIPVSESGRYSKNTLCALAPKQVLGEQEAAAASFFCVHRLDRDTSGLCVMARTKAAAQNLGRQFSRSSDDENNSSHSNNNNDDANDSVGDGGGGDASSAVAGGGAASSASRSSLPEIRPRSEAEEEEQQQELSSSSSSSSLEKEYVAVVVGRVPEPLDIRLRIGFESDAANPRPPATERALKKVRVATATEAEAPNFGRHAHTIVTPIAFATVASSSSSTTILTAVRVRLLTGRTHQIRIHLAAAGFPLVGEKLYTAGGGSVDCDCYLRRVRGEEEVVHRLLLDGATSAVSSVSSSRHLLHAARLQFRHPTTNELMSFESSPWPLFLTACPALAQCFDRSLFL